MKQGIRDSIDGYDGISSNGVHPISREDGSIINKLSKILSMIDIPEKLRGCVRNWKSIPDSDVLSILEEVELDIEQDVEDLSSATIDYITIGRSTIKVSSLFSLGTVDTYDQDKCEPVFKIIINESDDPRTLNGNKEVSFDDWADRDIELERLRERLGEFTNIRFL